MIFMSCSRRLLPVLDSSSCFCIVLAGFIWFLMDLQVVGCFWPGLDDSGRFWPKLWISFSSWSMI